MSRLWCLLLIIPHVVFGQMEWEWLNPKPHGYSITSIAYGKNCYVGAGWYGTIIRSEDGVSWNMVKSGAKESLRFVGFFNETFFALGDNGTLLRSEDGLSWSRCATGTLSSLTAMGFGGSCYFVAGESGTLLTSDDGKTWNSRNSGTDQPLKTAFYFNGQCIVTTDTTFCTTDKMHLCHDSTIVLTSKNGVSWTRQMVPPPCPFAVVPGNDRLVAVSSSDEILSSPRKTVSTSTDGIHWTSVDDVFPGSVRTIAYGNNIYVVASDDSGIYTSPDASVWSRVSGAESSIAVSLYALFFGDNRFVATGGVSLIYTSEDGRKWENKTSTITDAQLFNIEYLNGQFIIPYAQDSLLSSPDGVVWQKHATGSTNQIRSLKWSPCYGQKKYVTVGYGGEIMTSPDLDSWTRQSSGTSADLTDVAYGNGMFVAVGNSEIILYSSDAVTWQKSTLSRESNPLVRGVIFCNNMFFATGDNCFFSSADGVTWVDLTEVTGTNYGSNICDIDYAGGRYIARSSKNIIFTSSDGVAWSSGQEFNGGMTVTINDRFYSFGYSEVLVSADGENWGGSHVLPGLPPYIYDICYGGNQLMAVGDNGDIVSMSEEKFLEQVPVVTQPAARGIKNESLSVQYVKSQQKLLVNFPLQHQPCNVSLFTVAGSRVLSKAFDNTTGQFVVSTASLAPGAYCIRVTGKMHAETTLFVVPK